MKNMLRALLKPLPITIVGVIVLELLVLLGFPALYEETGLAVFGTMAMVLFAVAVPLLAVIGVLVHSLVAQKQSAQIEAELDAQAEQQIAEVRPDRQGEVESLRQQFDAALGSLKSSRLGRGALYALPWYVIIGPPGSGKTTMLIESDLDFPQLGHDGRGVRGVGGTRNCDWWFTDSGILLDTAGRYTTESEDHDEWLSFLRMLYRARRRKPINGAIVAISITDLVGKTDDEIAAHAAKVRDRLQELTRELELLFPVYLVFTKCDLLEGFVETFGTFGRKQRGRVWGHTFPAAAHDDSQPPEAVFDEAFAGLYERLSDRRLAMMAIERPAAKQEKVFAFPLQFAGARRGLQEFVRQLCQPNPYQERAAVRGVYFTSGTQEGAPIDLVLQAMSDAFGIEREPPKTDDEHVDAKSYFIDDLFSKIVFPDQGLATSSAKAERRRVLLRRAGLIVAAVATVLISLLFVVNFVTNRGHVSTARSAVVKAKDSGLFAGESAGEFDPGDNTPKAEAAAELLTAFRELEDGDQDVFLGTLSDVRPDVRSTYRRFLRRYLFEPGATSLAAEFEPMPDDVTSSEMIRKQSVLRILDDASYPLEWEPFAKDVKDSGLFEEWRGLGRKRDHWSEFRDRFYRDRDGLALGDHSKLLADVQERLNAANADRSVLIRELGELYTEREEFGGLKLRRMTIPGKYEQAVLEKVESAADEIIRSKPDSTKPDIKKALMAIVDDERTADYSKQEREYQPELSRPGDEPEEDVIDDIVKTDVEGEAELNVFDTQLGALVKQTGDALSEAEEKWEKKWAVLKTKTPAEFVANEEGGSDVKAYLDRVGEIRKSFKNDLVALQIDLLKTDETNAQTSARYKWKQARFKARVDQQKEKIVELARAYWFEEYDVDGRFTSRFPFDQDADEEVDPAALAEFLKPDIGSLETFTMFLRILGDEEFERADQLERDVEFFGNLRDAIVFGDDGMTIEFKLDIRPSPKLAGGLEGTRLVVTADQEIPPKGKRMSPASIRSETWRWVVGVPGSDLQLKPSVEIGPDVLSYWSDLDPRGTKKASPWSFLRLVHAADQSEIPQDEHRVECVWSYPARTYEDDGDTKVFRGKVWIGPAKPGKKNVFDKGWWDFKPAEYLFVSELPDPELPDEDK